MGKRTKPGEPPDMRTLDDPGPEPISAITADKIMSGTIHGIMSGTIHGGAIETAPGPRWKLRAMRMPPPTAWYRFWTRVLLGWRWKRIDQ